MNFLVILALVHISIVHGAKMAENRPGQPAYTIFSIKCRFQVSTPGVQRGLHTRASNSGTP